MKKRHGMAGAQAPEESGACWNRPKNRVLYAGTLAVLCAGCLRPAEERVERDLAVGRSQSADLQVEVTDGLAAVRGMAAARVHLWQSAPTIDVHLRVPTSTVAGEAGAPSAPSAPNSASQSSPVAPLEELSEARLARPRQLELFVENCMPRGELVVRSGQAQVRMQPSALPTECRYELLVETELVSLRLAEPQADESGDFHFGVLSDIQEAIDRVVDVYRRINQETHLSFVLGAGDLTERGTEEELQRFQQELKALQIPYYTTLGNHELGPSPPPYHDYFGRGNFSFEYRQVRFTLLDSASATLDPQVYRWLDGWLEQGAEPLHIVAMHIPPLDPIGVRNGAFASRNEASKLLQRLAGGGVDLTLYGHIHSHYRFSNGDIPAHISGGGGAIPERFDSLGRHFLDVTVAGGEVAGVRVVRVD
jgi:3',5'-cyclic-AMP phosphodiesterase